MDRDVDDLITRGYEVKAEGETSTRLKQRDWGDGPTHLFLALATVWWTFGLANALYALYKYTTADEILVKMETDPDETQPPDDDS